MVTITQDGEIPTKTTKNHQNPKMDNLIQLWITVDHALLISRKVRVTHEMIRNTLPAISGLKRAVGIEKNHRVHPESSSAITHPIHNNIHIFM